MTPKALARQMILGGSVANKRDYAEAGKWRSASIKAYLCRAALSIAWRRLSAKLRTAGSNTPIGVSPAPYRNSPSTPHIDGDIGEY